MRYDQGVGAGVNYAPCRYGTSRLYFRGPPRDLSGPHIAFLGGTETYGKFIDRPFVTLVEEATGIPAVNLGVPNASVDTWLHDPGIRAIAAGATLNVVQIGGAHNLSNRFYTVHPRRNDRFIRASSVLRAIYPEVDFSDICFTRHLLGRLHDTSRERFDILRAELQTAWSARMRLLLEGIGRRTLLLWFAPHLPSDLAWNERPDPLRAEPLFVTRRMVDALRPLVRGVVLVQPSARALAQGTAGMLFTPLQEPAARELPGPLAHEEAALALSGVIRDSMPNDPPVLRLVAG